MPEVFRHRGGMGAPPGRVLRRDDPLELGDVLGGEHFGERT
jgi:hypothetical protein